MWVRCTDCGHVWDTKTGSKIKCTKHVWHWTTEITDTLKILKLIKEEGKKNGKTKEND